MVAGSVENIAIRPATVADAPALARLRYAFRAAYEVPAESEDRFVARCTVWMADRLARATGWHAWLAKNEAGAVGHLWLQLIEKIPNPVPELEQHAYITNVYVDPRSRGAGVGRLLMEAALAFCSGAGVDSVILWPSARSRSLYRRHGFVEAPGDIMEAILDPGRQPLV